MRLNDENTYPECKRCGSCCRVGVLCMTEADFRSITKYIDAHGVTPNDYGDARCCFQNDDHTCMIWEARPQVCRLHNCTVSREKILAENPSLQVDEDLWLVNLHEAFVNRAMDAEKTLWGSWSSDGQTPAYLAATRMASLSDRNVAAILEQLHLMPGMNVLDVGCGSGEFCFRLGSQIEGVTFTGLDLDKGFVRFASERARGLRGYPFETPNPRNEYQFVSADGTHMPFDDATFDAVISHTFLTAAPCWNESLAEMRRVCKPGGIVSSVTSLTDDFYGTGTVRLLNDTLPPDDADLVSRVDAVRMRAFPEVELTAGIAPRDVPAAFARAGLEHVSCLPLGHYICLSDAQASPEDCRRFLDLLRLVEEEQLARLIANPLAKAQLPDSDWQRFAHIVASRHDELVSQIGSNSEWNWYGNASLLVVGTVPCSDQSSN